MGNIKMIASRVGLKVRKHSHTILTITGVAGLVTAGVMACVQTKKVDKIIERHKNRLEDVHNCKDEIVKECGEVAYRASVTKAYIKTFWDFTKLYGIPLVIAGSSVAAILCGHNIISKRHAALSTAYNTLNTAFNSYRERVRTDVGEEKEREYYTGRNPLSSVNKHGDTEEELIDEIQFAEDPRHKDAGSISPYARYFDDTSAFWKKDAIYNKNWIISQQNWANNLLKSRSHVFLNEVYEALGFPHTKAGAVVGWVLSDDGSTDNYIDFGLYKDPDGYRSFINEDSRNILLDFNVDGVIYDLI